MIDSKIFPEMDLGSMSWLTDEGVLTYYGYGAGFSAGKPGQDVFAGSFKEMKDGIIYCLLEPATISTFPSSLKKRLSNPEILNSISEEDNRVIAKLYLTK